MTESIICDSYQCRDCGLWLNVSQSAEEPDYCPYCGKESLKWQTDSDYKLVEITDR